MDRSSKWPRLRRDSLCPAVFAVLLAGALLRAAPVVAAGAVGSGTPESCTEAALDAALAGGGPVTFNCGTEPVTITITSTKTIAADTTIDGGSLITISGGHSVRVFSMNPGTTFTVQNLTIADGDGNHSPGGGGFLAGGGILNEGGTLTVTNSTFSGNSAAGGAGIANGGTLTVTSSVFSGNGPAVSGAGIANFGTLTVTSSVFSANSATFGGGIHNTGTLKVTNSTFSGNSAALGGGGIDSQSPDGTATVANSTFSGNSGGGIGNSGTLTVTNSTFSGNSGGSSAGIRNAGTLMVTNSTFSGNSATVGGSAIDDAAFCGDAGNAPCPATLTNTIVASSSSGDNCAGTITDGGHNLDSDGTCGVGPATTPLLDPAGLAADNGGPTQTIALQPGSPAIDAGDSVVCANPPVNGLDQRGYVRPGVGHTQCSIGAYEADAIPAPPCAGDCDGNGAVTINELILGVNIVLDLQPVDACPAFANADGMVDIAQLIKGVNNALGGCGLG